MHTSHHTHSELFTKYNKQMWSRLKMTSHYWNIEILTIKFDFFILKLTWLHFFNFQSTYIMRKWPLIITIVEKEKLEYSIGPPKWWFPLKCQVFFESVIHKLRILSICQKTTIVRFPKHFELRRRNILSVT